MSLAKCPLCGSDFVDDTDPPDCMNCKFGIGAPSAEEWNALAAMAAKARAFDAFLEKVKKHNAGEAKLGMFGEIVPRYFPAEPLDMLEELAKARVALGLPPVEEVKG